MLHNGTSEQEPYLHEQTFGTGALFRAPDPRDYDMRRLPGVQEALAIGLPESDEHLREHIVWTGNQGASPSCVWHTIAGIQSTNEHIERHGQVMVFDAMRMHGMTGAANEGRYTGDMLKIAQDQGTFVLGSSQRYRIGSYAFAPKNSQQEWVDTIKAAIVSGHICCLALRLPSNFGWESSGSVLGWNTYHEVKLAGFRPGAWLIHNSWGSNWGRDGYGWMPLDLLFWNNWQEGAVFANTVIDGIDDDLSPLPKPPTPPEPPTPPTPPTPTRRTVVTANATGGGLEFLKRDKPALTASGGGFSGNLEVTNVVEYEVPPGPNPPEPPNPPNPPDPGGLKIDSQARGSGLYVWVRDAAGASVGATVKVQVGAVDLMAFNKHTGSNVPATFLVGRNHGTAVIFATTDAGASVTGNAQV